MVANPLACNGGLFLQRFQGIEGAATFFGQVVDASAPSATADDVGVSYGHQTALDEVVQRHVEGGTHEAQAFRHAGQAQFPWHVPSLTQTVGKWTQPAEDPGLRLGQHEWR